MKNETTINGAHGALVVTVMLDANGHEVFEVRQVPHPDKGVNELVARGILGMKQGGSWPILNPGHRK